MRIYKPRLHLGDVLRTHPKTTFWGCAVVLAAWPQTEEFGPRCHIGISNVLMTHEFAWTEIDPASMKIIEFDRHYRTTPTDNRLVREVCIYQYANFGTIFLPVIGTVDPTSLWSPTLTREVGNGTDGNYPTCGKIDDHLGIQAVINWRRIHDREALDREDLKSDQEHFALMEQLRNKL